MDAAYSDRLFTSSPNPSIISSDWCPHPDWIRLELDSGKLVAMFDPKRGLLQVRVRGEEKIFDLAALTYSQI